MKKSSPGSTQLPTSRHLLSPSQPLIVTSVTYIHLIIACGAPLAYGLGNNNHCATHVGLLHGQDTEVGILSECVERSRDKLNLTKKKKKKKKEGKCMILKFDRHVICSVNLPSIFPSI